MSGEDHDAVLAQLHQQVAEADAFARVQPGSRLVHHQDTRQVQQDQGDADTLFHPPGEGAYLLVLALGHVDGLKDIFQPFTTHSGVDKALQDRLVVEKFPGRHILVRPELLRQETDQALQLLPVDARVEPVDPDTAVALFEDAADDTHQGGLARPVRSQEAEHTRTDLKRHAPERLERPAAFPDQRDAFHHAEPRAAQPGETPLHTLDIDLLLIQIAGSHIDGYAERPQHSDRPYQVRVV